MPLNDDINLGRLTDEEGDDFSQEEINEESLYEHDIVELYELIGEKTSEYSLKFLLNNVREDDIEVWRGLLVKIVKRYSLNPLKFYLGGIGLSNMHIYVRDLLIDLKIKISEWILDKKFTVDISRDDFEEFLKTQEGCILLKYAIKFIDAESYKTFIQIIFSENKQTFSEI